MGPENAISGEARFCLSLWGLHEGLLGKAGTDVDRKRQTLKARS